MPKKSALREYLDTAKSESRMIGPVERHMLTRPLDTSRRLDVLHPSEMIKDDWCHRASCYLLMGRKPANPERPNLRLESIFHTGHDVHHKWQGWLREMGVLYGAWKVPTRQRLWALSADVPSSAEYAEVPLHDESLRIAGHSDGWVKGLGEDFLIEIKSIGPGTIRTEAPGLFEQGSDLATAWRNIRKPFRSHLKQGKLYLALGQRMADVGIFESFPSEIVFIYDLKADQSYKEFSVYYEDGECADVFAAAADIVAAVASGEVLECNIASNGCKKCKALEEA